MFSHWLPWHVTLVFFKVVFIFNCLNKHFKHLKFIIDFPSINKCNIDVSWTNFHLSLVPSPFVTRLNTLSHHTCKDSFILNMLGIFRKVELPRPCNFYLPFTNVFRKCVKIWNKQLILLFNLWTHLTTWIKPSFPTIDSTCVFCYS